MRTLKFIPVLFLLACATAPTVASRSVASVLDDWHRAAAVADEVRYFSHFAPEGVFLGTDATERWTTEAFRVWAHPYFTKGKAWTFVPRNRNVTISKDGQLAWFDEELESQSYGKCRGSGVLQRRGGTWKIEQYNLTIPIPNALADDFVAKIRQQSK